jgi:hypothetical protein
MLLVLSITSARGFEETFRDVRDEVAEDFFRRGGILPYGWEKDEDENGSTQFYKRDEFYRAVGEVFSKPVHLGFLTIAPPDEENPPSLGRRPFPSIGLFMSIGGKHTLFLTQQYSPAAHPERLIFRRDLASPIGSFAATLVGERYWHEEFRGLSQVGISLRSYPVLTLGGVTFTWNANLACGLGSPEFIGFVNITLSRQRRAPRP